MSNPTTNASTLQPPNHFELAGDHAQITYDTTSISGQPLFHYKDDHHDVQEHGANIHTADSELGTLVTITIGVSALQNVRVSLVVPRIELRDPAQGVELHTLAIVTTTQTEGIPPVRQTYRVLHLHGTARLLHS